MVELLDGIRILRIDRAEADQFLGVTRDVFGNVLVRHQDAHMSCTKAKHYGAINGLHGGPVAVEIDMDILVALAGHGFRIGDKVFPDVTRALPHMSMNVYDH